MAPVKFLLCLLIAFPMIAWGQSAEGFRFDDQAVDPTANPCDDFYQYACGGWLTRNPIPPDRS